MNNGFGFEKENLENNNIPLTFSENNPQKLDVEIDFSEPKENIKPTENTEGVDNTNNIINTPNTYNNGQNFNNQPNFSPDYYSYQPSYQPKYNNPPVYNSGYNQPPIVPEYTRLFIEKTAVKRTSNHIGLGLILFYALQIVFSIILGFFMVSKEAYDFINDSAITLELNIILTFLGFGLAAFFIFKTEKAKVDKFISYGPPKKGMLLASVMTGIGFCYVANMVVSMLQAKFQNILPFAQNDIELPDGIFGFILSVLSVSVAPALIEEFLFRGAIMGNLLKYGKSFAIFTSAFLFALVHGNLVQIPFAFLVGLVLGVLVIETKSIWTGIIIHFINNFISVCIDYLNKLLPEEFLNLIFPFLLAIFIIIGIIGIYILSIKNKDLFSYKKTEHISTSVKKFGWFSSSVAMIIYFVIIFLEILAMQLTA